MHLSAPRSIQFFFSSVLGLATLGLLIGAFTIWQLAQNLESLEEELRNTESFLHLESPIETELVLRDIDVLLDLPGNEDRAHLKKLRNRLRDQAKDSTDETDLIQAIELRKEISLARSALERVFLVEGALLLLLFALAVFTWTRTIRPLNQLLAFFSRSFASSDCKQGNQGLPSEPRPLSLSEAARLCELSEGLSKGDAATADQQIEVAVKALLQQQLALAHSEKQAISIELAASLAHEIRNPLAAIQMSLSNLIADLRDEEIVERIERISAEVLRIGRIVGQTVETTRLDPEPESAICLASLADEILRLMKFQLPTSISLQNKIARDLYCNLPKERIRRALFNLISNSAASIGNAPGLIGVEARVSDSDLEISVTDNGAGFPEEILSMGGRALTKNTTGTTGLGLAVVRRITRDAGGDMKLENLEAGEREQGARVVLLLPSCVDNG